MRKSRPINERFLEKFKIDYETGCWVWIASTDSFGYGRIGFYENSKCVNKGAHVVSYILFKSANIGGKNVCHTCDNPPCVNPEHLFLGTQQDNVNDMRKKGRAFYPGAKTPACVKGELNNNSKLTVSEVKEIRHKRNIQKIKLKFLAKEYNISLSHVSCIARTKNWRYLK